MFDLRYHVASLAAVFVALVIGILVGVGLSGRSVVTESERRNLQEEIDRLERELGAARVRSDEQESAQAFEQESYRAVMKDRLRDKAVGLVFVGSADGRLRESVARAVEDASGRLVRTRALRVPLDGARLQTALARSPETAELRGRGRLPELGRGLGQELVLGGETPLWDAVGDVLVEERSGGMEGPLDAVVVVRSVPPQKRDAARFLAGFYRGLGSTGAPAVGVEETDTDPTAVPVYERAGISTVNNVETPTGRVSLAVLLSGTERGHFGFDAKDGYLPAVEPVPEQTG
jgi:hypothetical protein